MANEDSTPDVMSSLPRTRPQRRSAKRDAAKPAAAKAAAKPKAKPAKPKAKPAKPRATPAKPRAKAPPKTTGRSIPPAGFATPEDTATRPPPGAVELVSTAIQAAGELAQIGLAVGGQAVKSALERIGRT